MGGPLLTYDERALKQRVEGLPHSQRVLLAAACAERLMPLYEWLANSSGSPGSATVRSTLDLAWSSGLLAPQAEQELSKVVELIPNADDPDAPDHVALVQNAVIAVAYAIRTAGSNDVQHVVWAARQLYDAADYIVQRDAPSHCYLSDVEHEAPIQLALRGLGSALADLETGSASQLQIAARTDGDALLAFFIAPPAAVR